MRVIDTTIRRAARPPGGDPCRTLANTNWWENNVCCSDSQWCGQYWYDLTGLKWYQMCCPAGTYCANAHGPKHLCCPVNHGHCDEPQSFCCGRNEYCGKGNVCCKIGQQACGGACCTLDEFCADYDAANSVCCPKGVEACGASTCCSPGAHCLRDQSYRPLGTCCPVGVDVCGSKCCNTTHPACDAATGVCCQAQGFKACGTNLCCPGNKVCIDPTASPK